MDTLDNVIPVVDFGECGLSHRQASKTALKNAGDEITNAFRTVGFCYLKNHGVDKEMLEKFMETWRSFFEQPVSKKQPFAIRNLDVGWTAMEQEKINHSRPGDLKEAFSFHPTLTGDEWPYNIEGSRQMSEQLYKDFTELAWRVLDALSVGLPLEDPSFLRDCHKAIGTGKNFSRLRALYYPALHENSSIKPGQVRLGEHSDYGSITLLYQDTVGGLEVQLRNGKFIPATPIPGTILINIGDLMQRWTSDDLLATTHRVLIQESELKRKMFRQSIVFFVGPDNDCLIRCLDGSNKYPPVLQADYLKKKLNATYPESND